MLLKIIFSGIAKLLFLGYVLLMIKIQSNRFYKLRIVNSSTLKEGKKNGLVDGYSSKNFSLIYWKFQNTLAFFLAECLWLVFTSNIMFIKSHTDLWTYFQICNKCDVAILLTWIFFKKHFLLLLHIIQIIQTILSKLSDYPNNFIQDLFCWFNL